MKIIGIAGQKQTGKSTLARILSENCKIPTVELAFANPLKDEICKALNITRGELELNKKLYRPLLQWWGTEYRRSKDKQYWITKFLAQLVPIDNNTLVIVSDVRFQNEYDIIRQLGGYCVKVIRHNAERDTHASEVELINTEMPVIRNDRDLEHLTLKAKLILQQFKLLK